MKKANLENLAQWVITELTLAEKGDVVTLTDAIQRVREVLEIVVSGK